MPDQDNVTEPEYVEPKQARFVYHGPPVVIQALDLEVNDGDEVTGPDRLENNAGFTRIKAKKNGGDS